MCLGINKQYQTKPLPSQPALARALVLEARLISLRQLLVAIEDMFSVDLRDFLCSWLWAASITLLQHIIIGTQLEQLVDIVK